ncbi:TPA: hypothetical protein ACKNXV_000651, partial [Neisseria gonorrhoeae]
LAVPSVLSAASSFCPDLNLIHYTINIFKSLLALLVLSMPSNTVRCNEPFSGSMVGNIFDISKIKSSSINIPSLYWDETL